MSLQICKAVIPSHEVMLKRLRHNISHRMWRTVFAVVYNSLDPPPTSIAALRRESMTDLQMHGTRVRRQRELDRCQLSHGEPGVATRGSRGWLWRSNTEDHKNRDPSDLSAFSASQVDTCDWVASISVDKVSLQAYCGEVLLKCGI